MNTTKIREIAQKLESASERLRVMCAQRAMLGTGKGACQKVYVEVAFDHCGKQGFKMDEGRCSQSPLMASKDMMALALCKAWDTMIEQQERHIARLSAELSAMTTEGS